MSLGHSASGSLAKSPGEKGLEVNFGKVSEWECKTERGLRSQRVMLICLGFLSDR